MKTYFKTFLQSIVFIFLLHNGLNQTVNAQCSGVNVEDSLALVALYDDTGGDDWGNNDNWLVGSVDTWYGVTLNSSGCKVEIVDLAMNNLSGTIPPEIENLDSLMQLRLEENYLVGFIPVEIGALCKLTHLYLNRNNFLLTTIPSTIGELCELVALDLSSNNLIGEIPAELGNLSNLAYLNLNRNGLSEEIPAELGNLVNLAELSLKFNDLSGSVPSEMENLVNLKYLDLSFNNLSSGLFAINDLTNLKTAILKNNNFGWWQSISIEGLDSLEIIDLSYNQLGGYAFLGENTHVKEVYLDNNLLEGEISPEWENLVSLEVLWLSSNYLTGNIPVELGNLTHLKELALSANYLSDTIPSELSNLGNLEKLYLGANDLEGNIPPELGSLSSLKQLYINSNNLSGSIPPELGNLDSLKIVSLDNNALSGLLPSELGNLGKLEWMYLQDNNLSGTIPPELGMLSNLKYLSLAHNSLTGEIPAELGDLSNLILLQFNHNKLTGSIPAELGNMSNLKSLVLAHNQFNGSLPTTMNNLTNIKRFTINDNQFIFSDLAQNYLALWDSVSNCNLGSSACASYVPQDSIDTHLTTNETMLYVEAGDVVNNTYTWYKTSSLVPIFIAEGDSLFSPTTSGTYYCEVRNSLITDTSEPEQNLVLHSRHVPFAFTCANALMADSLVLVQLYNATGGSNWENNDNWLSGTLDSWYGVSLNEEGCKLEKLDLSSNNLSGVLPTELGNLNELTELKLDQNTLIGMIPSELSYLTKLNSLYLADNQLNGSIPPSLGNLLHLTHLVLHLNNLGGTIPLEIGNLISLQNLSLHNNQLVGDIPTSIGNLAALTMLQLHNNQLSGTIPIELTNLTELALLELQNNQLDGCLFEELQTLCTINTINIEGNANLFTQDWDAFCTVQEGICIDCEALIIVDSLALVELYHATGGENWTDNTNWLSGNLNTWYGVTLTANECNVEQLLLAENNLIGQLPEELANLNHLTTLSLSDNQLKLCLPNALKSLCNTLIVADIANNPELGTQDWYAFCAENEGNCHGCTGSGVNIQDSLALVEIFTAMVEDNCQPIGSWLVGPVEDWYGVFLTPNGCNVEKLILYGCAAGGILSPAIGNLTQLEEINFYANNFTGIIPPELGNLSKLRVLDLRWNEFTGIIPPELGNLPNLQVLDLSLNELTGAVPAELGNLSELKEFYLNENQLSGYFPTTLDNLNQLNKLWIDKNKFTFGDLTDIHDEIFWELNDCYAWYYWNWEPHCFVYAPQEDIPTLVSEDGTTLYVDAGDVSKNTYRWYAYEEESITLTATVFADSIFVPPSSGTYYCRVSNLDMTIDNGTLFYDHTLYLRSENYNFISSTEYSCIMGELVTDSLALVALYNATDGNSWTNNQNWLNGSVNSWYGVTVTEDGCGVAILDLSSNNLVGTLPPEIGDLSKLEELRLFNNQLTGAIPPEIGNLNSLLELRLFQNQLNESLPSEIGNLDNLVLLSLNHNQLSGSIPDEIGNMSSIEEVYLNHNQLTGSLPVNLVLLYDDNLSKLYLNSNQLSGCIPDMIQILCTGSIYLNLNNNPDLYTQDWWAFCEEYEGACSVSIEEPRPSNTTNQALQIQVRTLPNAIYQLHFNQTLTHAPKIHLFNILGQEMGAINPDNSLFDAPSNRLDLVNPLANQANGLYLLVVEYEGQQVGVSLVK